jgi:ASC-1-like (ASCH) protein
MKHEMNLQPKYYDFIKNGTKRIELRLYDEKRSKINIGDIIEFNKSENDKIMTKVVGLLRYSSFEKLFDDFNISILSDSSMTKQELLDVLNKFYTPLEQKKLV